MTVEKALNLLIKAIEESDSPGGLVEGCEISVKHPLYICKRDKSKPIIIYNLDKEF